MQTMMNVVRKQHHAEEAGGDSHEGDNNYRYQNMTVDRRSDRKTTPINVSYTGIVLDPNMIDQ